MDKAFSQNNFSGGIQNYPKTSTIQNGYYFGYCVNYRDDPQAITLYPGSIKESGSVITDLLLWGDLLPSTADSYFYGNTGNIYHRNSSASWSNIHTAASSHGNGLAYFFADDYLYYTCDSTIGRYGAISNTPTFSDDFLTAQGGVPTNTASLVLASASSQYAHAADSASLSITSDLTLETYFKATTLPTVGNSMTLIGKWDESGATRSYKMDLFGVSGFFGGGGDGSLTISVNTTDAPIDSAATATSGAQSISATNASFATGQKILIIQSQGTGAGKWEINTINGYTAGTITTATALMNSYTTGAQVIVGKQYTNVTINNGVTWTAKAWNGTTGGILFFYANGTVTNNGTISANGCGFRGGSQQSGAQSTTFLQGEGESGTGSASNNANGEGGGGGSSDNGNRVGGGGGGGYGTTGTAGGSVGGGPPAANGGNGGNVNGSADLTTMLFGGGGGAGAGQTGSNSNAGANGGGALFINTVTLTNNGTISSNGANGTAGLGTTYGGAGAGAGGSVLLKVQTATLGSSLVVATGGTGGSAPDSLTGAGGNGGNGRIDINYLTSYTGTTSPTINAIQDNTLVTTTTIQGRLGISNDGTANEFLTKNLNISTGNWYRLSIAWTASTSTANFYLNGVSLGASIGTKTSINDNISLLYVGADQGASTIQNYFNGKLNDMRIWSNVQTASQIYANNQIQVASNSVGLQAYYKFNSAYTDATSNANNLTAVNTPTFDTADVPFPAPTTRLDIDKSYTTTGSTYTLPTAISEAGTDTLSFTPTNDPQKSVAFNVDTKGTGNWTVTVHDQQNRVIATKTITNANVLTSGYMEFIFSTPWRIVIGKTYHMHLTVSTGTSKAVSSSLNDFSTGDFYTYFGFLVTDTQYHPILPFLNFLAIGNERYIAKWDGAFYSPNLIALPTGWRVRCLSTWREYLAIGVWRGTSITSYTHGRIYFWDGIAPTFNFFIDVPDGQINAMWGRDSDLFIIAGYRGDLLDYQGNYFFDTGNSQSSKIRFLPKRSSSDVIEVLPGALNYYRSLVHIGYAASSSSTSITRGTYSYGTYDPQLPQTLSCDYLLSTDNSGSTVSIGLVYPIGSKLIVGWQDGSGFGADVVDFTNNPAPQGRIELMIRDDGAIWHYKTEMQIRADFLALRSGESLDVALNIDRGGWVTSPKDSTIGDTFLSVPAGTLTTGGTARAREIQLAVDLYSTGTTSPTLLGLSSIHDPLNTEQQF